MARSRTRGLVRIRRLLLIAAIIIFTISVPFKVRKYWNHSLPTEEVQLSLRSPTQPQLQRSDLSLTLNRTESEIPSVKVTVTNYHHSTKVSLLMWESPFDPQAVATGIFRVVDKTTGEEVPSIGLKMSRLLSPKTDDFVELLPRHAVTKDVPLEEPDIALLEGHSYEIQVRSSWKAVWHADVKDVGETQLKRIGGPTGLLNWEYESNKFILDVPFDHSS